jgi:hypothetical protein
MTPKPGTLACTEDVAFILAVRDAIHRLIHDLKVNRIGCLSNRYPNYLDERHLLENLYYICFPFANPGVESDFLFYLQYYRNYRKVAYNVVPSRFENAIKSRSFPFIDHVENGELSSNELMVYLKDNIHTINASRPFLVRIKSANFDSDLGGKFPMDLLATFNDNFLIRANI